MWRYSNYLRSEYEDRVMGSLNAVELVSYVDYDVNNLFVYIPIDRQIAFDCNKILEKENFKIRGNIFNNVQAGK